MSTGQAIHTLYKQPNLRGLVRLTMKAIRKQSRPSRASALNKLRDYMWLMSTPEYHDLHFEFSKIIDAARWEWESYDYGEGYFYQSNPDIGIHGLRDTDARFEEYQLAELLKDLTVFEIGSNCGFLSLKIAKFAKHVTGLEINPFLCEIASATADKLALEERSTFNPISFEDFSGDAIFDAVLSFANHTTYDQNTSQGLDDYFRRCRSLLNEGGLFLFESHAPEFELGKLPQVIEVLKRYFDIERQNISRSGSFLDVGRKYLVCRAGKIA